MASNLIVTRYADGAAPAPTYARRSRHGDLAKATLDVSVAVVLLVLLAPVLAVIAIAIKLDSRGPVLFVQERLGSRFRRVDGQVQWEPVVFRFYKFRSMTTGADQDLHRRHIEQYVQGGAAGHDGRAAFKLASDARITRVGKWIRRTSLDELPQLLNVVKRDMSLVGPRPVPTYEGYHYLEHHPERFETMPGITGLWQVEGRCDLTFEEAIALDLQYVRERSLHLDLKILVKTIPAILSGKGAA